MSRKNRGMVIQPHDRGTFLVSSERDPNIWYLVDISDPKRPHGRCNCEDYAIRVDSFLNRGEHPLDGKITCKHINLLRDILINAASFLPVALGKPDLEHGS